MAQKELREILVLARTQSRPAPNLADILVVLGKSDARVVETGLDDVIASQKRGADPVRAMKHALSVVLHPDIPEGFKLSDRAIATLVTVLFEMKEAVTADAVKMNRKRSRTK